MAVISTDPIADMLTRIRNAISVRKNEVTLPYSTIKEEIAKLLKDNHLIESLETISSDDSIYKTLKITINKPETNARITAIERMSTPGRRLYTRSKRIPSIKNGRGFVVVSTSQGLMTGAEAKKKGIGGELIFKIY